MCFKPWWTQVISGRHRRWPAGVRSCPLWCPSRRLCLGSGPNSHQGSRGWRCWRSGRMRRHPRPMSDEAQKQAQTALQPTTVGWKMRPETIPTVKKMCGRAKAHPNPPLLGSLKTSSWRVRNSSVLHSSLPNSCPRGAYLGPPLSGNMLSWWDTALSSCPSTHTEWRWAGKLSPRTTQCS